MDRGSDATPGASRRSPAGNAEAMADARDTLQDYARPQMLQAFAVWERARATSAGASLVDDLADRLVRRVERAAHLGNRLLTAETA